MPVADLAGLNMQLTSCYFAATPDSTRSCNASGPTTRPGEEDLSDLIHRRTEEHWRGLAGHLAPRDVEAVGNDSRSGFTSASSAAWCMSVRMA